MPSRISTYIVDDGIEVRFEYEPLERYAEVGVSDVVGTVRAAIAPAVAAAREVLTQLKEVGPDSLEVKFGIKVAGDANWVVAKASTEASFEVTLGWRPRGGSAADD